MVGDLKSKSVKGVIWSFVESASTKVIQFVISVIMARLLMPEDYGIVAIIFCVHYNITGIHRWRFCYDTDSGQV